MAILATGAQIPDIAIPDQNANTIPLFDHIGKQGAIIYFYPKDNTPSCTIEANDFQKLQGEFEQLGVAVIGISKDSIQSHDKFCNKYGLAFTLLSDTQGEACERFGVWQEKKNYGKTYMGIVRSTFSVDANGRIINVYTNVKTKGHAEKVLNEIKSASNTNT